MTGQKQREWWYSPEQSQSRGPLQGEYCLQALSHCQSQPDKKLRKLSMALVDEVITDNTKTKRSKTEGGKKRVGWNGDTPLHGLQVLLWLQKQREVARFWFQVSQRGPERYKIDLERDQCRAVQFDFLLMVRAKIMVCCLCLAAVVSVFPIKMQILHLCWCLQILNQSESSTFTSGPFHCWSTTCDRLGRILPHPFKT